MKTEDGKVYIVCFDPTEFELHNNAYFMQTIDSIWDTEEKAENRKKALLKDEIHYYCLDDCRADDRDYTATRVAVDICTSRLNTILKTEYFGDGNKAID